MYELEVTQMLLKTERSQQKVEKLKEKVAYEIMTPGWTVIKFKFDHNGHKGAEKLAKRVPMDAVKAFTEEDT